MLLERSFRILIYVELRDLIVKKDVRLKTFPESVLPEHFGRPEGLYRLRSVPGIESWIDENPAISTADFGKQKRTVGAFPKFLP